ncbi:MAG TPA: phosphatase PAP2 family protein [Candidatus Kapabacteria bacterium]|nr:phosphatase PAP2 family protein [Candidatus Kapabacteria bacterium]
MRRSHSTRSTGVLVLGLLLLLAFPAGAQTQAHGPSPFGLYSVDAAVESAMQSGPLQSNQLLQAVGNSFNWYGGTGVILLAILLWLGGRLLRRPQMAEAGLRGLEAIAAASFLGWIAKVAAGRARPYFTPGEPWHWNLLHSLSDTHYFSMPSGHTIATCAFAGAVCFVALGFAPLTRRTVIALAALSSVLVAFARVYTHQHWLSDVAAAALLGSLCGVMIARWHATRPGRAFDRVMLGSANV